jgi:serine/threonine protein phosphatase PrpC
MVARLSGVKARVGFCSDTGPRERNEDFAGAVFGWELPEPRRDVVAAIADGIGSAKGGRVAAETAVRGRVDATRLLQAALRRQAAIELDARINVLQRRRKSQSRLSSVRRLSKTTSSTRTKFWLAINPHN